MNILKQSHYGLPFIIIMFSLGMSPSVGHPQSNITLEEQTKYIRIKKITNEWQGSVITLHTRNDDMVRGRLLKVSGDNYHLAIGGRNRQIPFEDVVKMTYEPGPPELMLSFGSALLGSAFLSGALLISKDDVKDSDLSAAALLGLLAGGYWGYSVFYESEIIYVE